MLAKIENNQSLYKILAVKNMPATSLYHLS